MYFACRVRLVDTEERLFLFSLNVDIWLVRIDLPPSSLSRWQRSVNVLRYVTKMSVHWDQHLLSRATLLPDHFCHSCNMCFFCVIYIDKGNVLCWYTSIRRSIPYFTRISFSSSFCFVFFYQRTCLIYMVSFFFSLFPLAFISIHLNFRVLFIPSSYAYQLPLSQKANSRRRGMSLTEFTPFSLAYVFSFFLLSPLTFLLE